MATFGTLQGATSTTLANVLKNLYVEPLVDQLNNEILVNQLLSVDSEHFEGLKAIIALHTSRSKGIGARLEGDDLPVAGNQQYAQAQYDMASHYGRVGVTGQAIMRSKSPAGAFVRSFDDELKRIKDDLALDFARQTYGTGDGVIATVNGTVTTSVTVPITSAEPIDKGYLYIGMSIDAGTSALPRNSLDGQATGTTIADVDASVPSITMSATVSMANLDKLTRAQNNNANVTKEMDAGIQKLFPTAANTVGGINAAAAGSKYWDCLRDTTGGALVLTGAGGLLLNWNRVAATGAKSSEVKTITTPGLVRRLFESADFKSNIRFVDQTDLVGGFESVSFQAGSGKITLYPDRLAPYGKVYMLHSKHVRMFSPGDWDFLARDGQPIKWQQEKDAWQAILYRYANMGTDRRNSTLVMSGLTDTGF